MLVLTCANLLLLVLRARLADGRAGPSLWHPARSLEEAVGDDPAWAEVDHGGALFRLKQLCFVSCGDPCQAMLNGRRNYALYPINLKALR